MLTIKECSDILSISPSSIYQHIKRKSRLGKLFKKYDLVWMAPPAPVEKYRADMRRPCEIRVQLSESERRILSEESKKTGNSRAFLLRDAFFGHRGM